MDLLMVWHADAIKGACFMGTIFLLLSGALFFSYYFDQKEKKKSKTN